MTVIPGLGHLNPMVPLLRALADAGHDVEFAVPASFVPYVTAAGFPATPVGPDWYEPEADAVLPGFLDGDTSEQHRALVRLATGLVPDLEAFTASGGADVILHDHAETAGWIVAERLGLPHVPFAMTARVLDPATMAVMGWAQTYDQVLVDNGLPPDAGRGRAARWLYLDVLPPSLTSGLLPPNPAVHHLRYQPDDRSGGGRLPAWLTRRAPTRPLVYVTLGTIFNRRHDVLGALVRGTARLDVDVLVTVGHDADSGAAGLGPLPANVHVERFVPQHLLYPQLAAVVCHGGFGTVFGALAHGVPVVCAPMSTDQPLNAGLVTGRGAGVNLATRLADGRIFPALGPGEPSEDDVAGAVDRVLTQAAHRAAARALGDEIAALPSPATVAALVERVVRSGEPVSPRGR